MTRSWLCDSRAALVAACLGGAAGIACADWPQDPASPLELGGVLGISAANPATAVTPDGATWAAWLDMECFGALRVQRVDSQGSLLMPGSLALDPVTNCVGRAARLAACSDGSVVVSGVFGSVNGGGPLGDIPVQRLGPDGASMWGSGVVVDENAVGNIGGFLGLPDDSGDGSESGDVLIAWHAGASVFVGRFAADGSPVWRRPASVAVQHGPTMRIFGVISDEAGGAYVVWDTPGTYTRAIFAARFTAEGAAAWPAPIHLTAVTPSSKHTDPVAIADGQGGMVVIWTFGMEQSDLPSPLYMQRLAADGSLAFDPEGARISLDFTCQFSVVVSRDEVGGDLFVAWRDGAGSQTLRAQRMTLAADRLWGDSGVAVASIGNMSHFDGQWNANAFAIALAGMSISASVPGVNVYRVDADGAVAAESWAVSGAQPASGVQVVALDEALGVTWFSDAPGFDDQVVAQRINSDGTLGPSASGQAGDFNNDGFVNGIDLGVLLSVWGPAGAFSAADINRDGLVDGVDLGMLLANWTL